MDLDFSFALVSSLTPRNKAGKATPIESLKKYKSLKINHNLPSKSQNSGEIFHEIKDEKENLIPKDQLMNKNEFLKPKENKKQSVPSSSFHSRQSVDKNSSSFSVNMENIAVRRNRSRRRKIFETSPLQPCDNVLENTDSSIKNVVSNSNLSKEKISFCAHEIINISSDIDDIVHKTQSNKRRSKRVRGKCHPRNRVSDSSGQNTLEIVESSEIIDDSSENIKDSSVGLKVVPTKNCNVQTRSTRISGVSETSLSTAYDSDSFQAIRRHGVKVIPETPDSSRESIIPESLRESSNEKRNSSILSLPSEENKNLHIFSCTNETLKKNLGTKRKSSEVSCSPEKNKKVYSLESLCNTVRPKRKSILSSTLEKNKQADENNTCILGSDNEDNKLDRTSSVYNNAVLYEPSNSYCKNKVQVRSEKKLRTSNDSSVLDMFKLESTIKERSPSNKMEKEVSRPNTELESISNYSNNEVKKMSILPVSRGRNNKNLDLQKPDIVKKKKSKGKNNMSTISKSTIDAIDGSSKVNVQTAENEHCAMSPKICTAVLPSEVIPKFEHINRWLEDTQKKTFGSLENYSASASVIPKKDIMPAKNKYKVSLSPRIKKKKDKAKSSLEEEQKLFEELYGLDYEKRLSDDVYEVASKTTCQDSVEFSENVLDKLYGTVWQKDAAITQSEPRKGKKNNSTNKTPLTERKKHRTSIYEVFSSSSSEDRFEEFLENVQRKKVESTKRHSGRPRSPEFINDSDSDDNASLEFYQNIISSTIKDEVKNTKREDIKGGQATHKVNRRRLSFGSSQDGCSESGKSNKDKKPSSKNTKTKTKKSRSKKKESKYIEGKGGNNDIDVFSLVTPLKIKGKKTENDVKEKISNPILPEVPKNVDKSKTPKNPTKQKELTASEERLKNIYLRKCDFKVPKSASKTFKTPSKTNRPDVPSSPALSFLSSLSEITAGLPCHPDALVYKKNFKSKREELAQRLFTLYNKEVFDNQLPDSMVIQWNTRMTSTSGFCYNKRMYRDNQILRSSRIVLSNKILDRPDRLRDTLIHELCHAATWIIHGISDGHGPIWKSWADKANRRFPELPVIKRCHDYAISTKFTYKCMTCGYSIGRHTKSLDTERKRCGYCYGKFQVFVTAKMSSASVTSGSDSVKTPRNPTGFALFVKENYAIIKKKNNVPHAQVMKLLSQKFAEIKISKQNADKPLSIE